MPSRIRTEAELERAFQEPSFLLFKHSRLCPVSARAFEEYERWADAHPGQATAWVEVVAERALARRIAELTGVRHESPQALWLTHGRATWNASHAAITAASLEAAHP